MLTCVSSIRSLFTVQSGLVGALLLLILAFRVPWGFQPEGEVEMRDQEVVNMEEIQQTEQQTKPSSPPRPPVPVEVPNDEIIKEEPVDLDGSLDLDAALNRSVPPPAPQKRNASEQDREVFVVVEERPELIGGMAALNEAAECPDFAIKEGSRAV